jgi:hypothetical protein
VWGAATTRSGEPISWGRTCVAADCGNGGAFPPPDAVAWSTDGPVSNIVWGASCDGADCTSVIWGAACETDECDNTAWTTGSDGAVAIAWATSCETMAPVCGDVVWQRETGEPLPAVTAGGRRR